MFAIKKILKGEKVLVWGGNYIRKKELSGTNQNNSDLLIIQWDDDLYSVEERGL